MTYHAHGEFTVKIVPQGGGDETEGCTIGRMTLEKAFSGDLVGTSKGEMMTAMADTPGSAAYVAIERVTGTIQGKTGTFVLHHDGVMAKGSEEAIIRVVPDSGTGAFAGISGTMTIAVKDSKHFYDFAYSL